MRWFLMLCLCVVIHVITADPDPKKYKPVPTEKERKADKSLTEDERKFLREVEEKFGVKSEITKPETASESKNKTVTGGQKPPFPAVIAIEIINDTETNSKGKRTIDANLGYGYRTNNGYSYSYFGRPTQDKGKFMIYPYSQEDIPASQNSHSINYSSGKHSNSHTSVEIQPSQAYELVEEHSGYDYTPPASQLKYENAKTYQTPAYTKNSQTSTLYTTYNGEGFSSLSGQFPSVMPNYFVDPTQLLKNPQYQNVGLTQEHLRNHGSHLEQRVVPVLVLRIPSSYIKNPNAELYPNLPNNYPLSQHLNSVNLQQLVSQYYKKNGYPYSPQIMSYQTPVSTAQSPVMSSNYEPQHYANPYVQPAYTQADYSGVQYSAVKPVMARYPLSYSQQKYLISQSKSLYRQPVAQQQYEYQYQHAPSTAQPEQSYYVQSQEHQTSQSADTSGQYHNEPAIVEQQAGIQEPVADVEYGAPQQQHTVAQEAKLSSVEYETPQIAQQGTHQSVPSYYETSQTSHYDTSQVDSLGYAQQQTSSPEYTSQSSEYYSPKQTAEKQTITVYPSQLIHSEKYQVPEQNEQQQYVYEAQNQDAKQGLVLTENYPTKDHTIATVLPYTYKQSGKSISGGVQTVSYVTPMPLLKYQSQYKIMVPQTVLRNPNSEKVSYVNSHSVPTQYYQPGHYTQESSAEQTYSIGTQYIAPAAAKPFYSRGYSSHPKRMAKPDNKPEASIASSTVIRKQTEKTDRKKSS